jgi:hypothetical protein
MRTRIFIATIVALALTTTSVRHGADEEDFAQRWVSIAAMACPSPRCHAIAAMARHDVPQRLARRLSAYLSAPQRSESAK